MWDYDKLFAEGNVVGLKNVSLNKIFNHGVTSKKYWNDDNEINWDYYKNNVLGRSNFIIQYIIRLDEHGNVIEKLFDREADMPKPMPELETGMFVRVDEYGDSLIGFVDAENNHVIYQDGDYDFIDDDDINSWGIASKIVEVYDKDTCAFNFCDEDTLIWRSPQYQTYLNSKESQ